MNERELKQLFISSIRAGHVNNNNTDYNIVYDSIESYDKYFNILMRSGILTQFAKAEKCRIDSIRFYPVELKSDDDVLDERLPNQVLNAILTFGRSRIVLDEKHSRRAIQRKIAILRPATIIGYSGEDDYFEVLSIFDKFVTNNVFSIKKRRLARILLQNGITDKIDRVYQCLTKIQALNQKLAFSELYNDDNVTFLKDEIDILRNLRNLHL